MDPKKQVIEVARLYATNVPGVIGWGNALENHGRSLQQCRAISILRALTANVKTPWGAYAELVPANGLRASSSSGELSKRGQGISERPIERSAV
jgi:anaerobic selenocysteine-containing dehydrogenase